MLDQSNAPFIKLPCPRCKQARCVLKSNGIEMQCLNEACRKVTPITNLLLNNRMVVGGGKVRSHSEAVKVFTEREGYIPDSKMRRRCMKMLKKKGADRG